MNDREAKKPEAPHSQAETEERIEEIAEEYLDLLQAGGTPDRQALIEAHPEIADLLDRRLGLVELMHGARPDRESRRVPTTRRREETPEGSGSSPDDTVALGSEDDSPEKIGPYRVLETLGKGGMGIVYLADQLRPVKRRVALKLIKLGMDTGDVIARFESERQALALMNHPSIAHVYEAGSTAAGRPYFAMEHVPGIPITDYCDRHRLDTPTRLGLFEEVCDAVQHAHQKGIIHRDLKPSNILVCVPNGRPVPKIIDFGVAKATNRRLTEGSFHTEHGRIIGTPEYMSPEQADATSLDIDTRSDIYSLGVILYELLSGALPFETAKLRKGGIEEIRRRIREEDPPKPSTRVSTLGESSTAVAQRRRTVPATLCRQLCGDLDWITMKAMEKDRVRRYATASELAADIGRHLRDEPVLAGPPSLAYKLGKYVRKYRGTAIAAAIVALALVVGLAVSLLLLREADAQKKRAEGALKEAQRQRDRADEARRVADEERTEAERQRERAEREAGRLLDVTRMLKGALESANPYEERREIRVFELLDRTVSELDATTDADPAAEAELRETIGRSYLGLGLYEKSEAQLRVGLEIQRRLLGKEDRKSLALLSSVALSLKEQGEYKEADRVYREALGNQRRVLGDDDPDTLETMTDLAILLKETGRLDEAEDLAFEALEARRRVLGAQNRATLASMHALAGIWSRRGELSRAEPLFRETLDLRRNVLGEHDPDTLATMNNLANLLMKQDKAIEAELVLRELLQAVEEVLGKVHPRTLSAMNNLARCLWQQRKLDEAETSYREVLASERRVLGEDHPNTLGTMINLARLLEDKGQLTETEEHLRKVLEATRSGYADSRLNLVAMDSLARFLVEHDRPEEAEPLLVELMKVAPQKLSPGDVDLVIIKANYGGCLALLGRFEEAEELLLPSLEALKAERSIEHRLTQRVIRYLSRLYEVWGKPEKAESYRAMLLEPAGEPPR